MISETTITVVVGAVCGVASLYLKVEQIRERRRYLEVAKRVNSMKGDVERLQEHVTRLGTKVDLDD